MKESKASAEWKGGIRDGSGKIELATGPFDGSYSYASRFETGKGTSPEELLGAAHAGCFSMALSFGLVQAGFPATSVKTEARVQVAPVEGGMSVTNIFLTTEAIVPGIDEMAFQIQAETAKKNCPISKALAAVDIQLDAKLVS